ncbi:Uma2 family endonuclease [Kitasatospora sp. MAA4]|uniref:Uma2 family endonuclease n=1 Tax=Kitasatospora sp. MAA4 TaxID=3035093 RepID=UPI002476486F|nr:Uma2 family endonuclease [Kitasatospora sp. MAA4]MDH6133089.1 Uma2 family endonuclease [Kitasatospora sp. MAA4]
MTAVASEPELDLGLDEGPSLDEVLWQAWLALELPEGYHAEIVEELIEVSPTGRRSHLRAANRLRDALVLFLVDSGSAAYQDGNLLHGQKVFIPDVFVGPDDVDDFPDPTGLGIDATRVELVAEVVSPGRAARERDLERKRRAYARAGIPIYVMIDDFDGVGHVTVLTKPVPKKAVYEASVRVPYGTEVTISEGPAKGFVIGVSITGKPREV